MSTPEQPDASGKAWSENPPPEPAQGGNPEQGAFGIDEQYGTAEFPAPPYPAQPYPDHQYETHQYPPQQYQGHQYQGQQYSAQGYPPPPPYYGDQGSAPRSGGTPPGVWVLVAVLVIALLGGLGYFLFTQFQGGDDEPTARSSTQADSSNGDTPPAVTASPRPSPPPSPAPPPRVSVPAKALSCPPMQYTAEFSASAVVGNTSCPFAEEVRIAYLQQSQRGANVSVRAWSPTTRQWYTMACAGGDVVMCTGGNSAVVYLY